MIHIPCQVTLYAKKKKAENRDGLLRRHSAQGVFSEKVMFEERSECRAARRREALGRHDSKYKAQRGRNKLAPLRNFRKKIAWEEQSKQGETEVGGAGIRRRGARTDCAGLQASENDARGVLRKYLEDGRWGGVALKVPSELLCSKQSREQESGRRVELSPAPSQALPLTRPPNDEVRATGHRDIAGAHPAPRPL